MTLSTTEQPARILVVDDNADQLSLVSTYLQRAGFAVHTADHARTGFDLACEVQPDLVISDVTMPDIDGIEFCNMIRANRALANTPILLVSALQKDTDSIVEGLHRGADDYLQIPYEPAILLAKAIRLVEVNRVVDALHQEKERLRFAISAARMGIWEWNIVTGKIYWSEDLEEIHGIAPGGFGGTVESLLRNSHPDDRELLHRSIEATLEEGTGYDIEYRVIWQNGEVHWVNGRGSVIRNRRGKPVQMIGLCMDITKRKADDAFRQSDHDELERRVAERTAEGQALGIQLRQSQKLEAIGRLAGGIAHDFNNLLTAIIGYSQISLNRCTPGEPLRSNLEEIRKAGERAAGLTRQLLAFSRKQVLQPRVLDLNSVVSELEKMLQRTIGEDLALLTTLQTDLGSVKADPGQVEQVILNLVVNARDAMPTGGKVTIETMNVDLDASYAEQHVGVLAGPYVMLAVSDTGIGMSEEIQRQIFEPFFTTKQLGKGTGLGLSTVYGIVKQSEGNIWVYSEPGQGTTFKIYFPRVDANAAVYKRPIPSTQMAVGTETILLIEDNELVRRLTNDVLTTSGYRVLEADSGTAALTIAERTQEEIHLILTDVVMPGMSGSEVTSLLLPLYPGARILYMSGYAENATVHHGMLSEGASFIQKPFSPQGLATKVREVLDASLS